ncbi:MAG: hypothetical protein LBE18_00710 [Planctomycetaceae bacterium]|jgi:outer membrane protein assembly factor BamD (BamD/ComL family)|nr:hypothetical protein [Planctomycetaceae bacterium]
MSIKNLFKLLTLKLLSTFNGSTFIKSAADPLTKSILLNNSTNIAVKKQLNFITISTIIFTILIAAGCQALQTNNNDPAYFGQTPNSIFPSDTINTINIDNNPPAAVINLNSDTSTSVTSVPIPAPAALPSAFAPVSATMPTPMSTPMITPTPNVTANITAQPNSVLSPGSNSSAVSNSPFLDLNTNTNANSPNAFSPNTPLNSDSVSAKSLSNYSPPPSSDQKTIYENIQLPSNSENLSSALPHSNSTNVESTNIRNDNSVQPTAVISSNSPFGNTSNNFPDITPPAENLPDVWGDMIPQTQSISQAVENENLERNRLLEIAKEKRLQEVDPKKKYLQPLSNRLGPFADRENREIIDKDINIISPVTYIQENPKIYDNKPIFDWEKEEQAAFDWSILDPVNFFNKIKQRLGLGINEEKAKKFMQEGRDILLKAKQKTDSLAPNFSNRRVILSKLSSKDRDELEKLYNKAGGQFALATKYLPDSLLQEDALYLQGESYFFGGFYTRAFNSYQSLMVKYKHSRYLDIVSHRLFTIARYWEAVDRNRRYSQLVNLSDANNPVVGGTFSYANKAYETIFINDPNNQLADDAVMAIASSHLARGKYEGDTSYEKAAFYYKYLTENYPLSEHFDSARKGELLARNESYMGAEYNDKTLNDAQELAEIIKRTQVTDSFDTDNDEKKTITGISENIVTKNAEREWVIGQYYDKKGYYGSAKLFYQKLIEKYPQTTYAEKARNRIEQLRNKPDKPSAFSLFRKKDTK